MEWVLALGGMVLLGSVGTMLVFRFVDPSGDEAVKKLTARVSSPLPSEIEGWLRPQLRRRTRGAMLGLVWGFALSIPAAILDPFPADDDWSGVPLYWLSLAVASGAGAIIGTLIASYPTGRDESARRTVSVRRRRLGDYFRGPELLQLRLSVPVALAAFAVAIALRSAVPSSLATQATVWCGLGLLVIVSAYAVARVLVSRPLVGSTTARLQWKEAMLAHTVEPMPWQAALSAVLSAGAVIVCVMVLVEDVPAWLVGCSLALLVLTVAAVSVVGVALLRQARPGPRGLAAGSGGPAPR